MTNAHLQNLSKEKATPALKGFLELSLVTWIFWKIQFGKLNADSAWEAENPTKTGCSRASRAAFKWASLCQIPCPSHVLLDSARTTIVREADRVLPEIWSGVLRHDWCSCHCFTPCDGHFPAGHGNYSASEKQQEKPNTRANTKLG